MDVRRGGPQEIPRPPTVHEGGPPVWSGIDRGAIDVSLERVRAVFTGRGLALAAVELPPARSRSAVAVVVSAGLPGPGAIDYSTELLLTRRAWHLRTHRGEIAFPGGIEDPGDDYPAGTALREANEEVGLDPSRVEVVGALDPLTTFAGGSAIVPVVAIAELRPSVSAAPAEVDGVLHVRLSELLDPGCYRQELWSWDGNDTIPAIDRHAMHFFELVGDTIWGATAAMLYQFLSLLVATER